MEDIESLREKFFIDYNQNNYEELVRLLKIG